MNRIQFYAIELARNKRDLNTFHLQAKDETLTNNENNIENFDKSDKNNDDLTDKLNNLNAIDGSDR